MHQVIVQTLSVRALSVQQLSAAEQQVCTSITLSQTFVFSAFHLCRKTTDYVISLFASQPPLFILLVFC